MSLFCDDRDLLTWETEIFSDAGVAHLALLKQVDATVSGTALTTAGGILANVLPGMVAVLEQGSGDSLVRTAVEIAAVASGSSATISVLRVLTDPAVAPAMQGAVKLTVVSFAALIDAVGKEITALLGLDQTPADFSGVLGLRPATVFGVLAAIYRAIGPTSNADKKLALYTRLYQIARRAVAGVVDLDGDGVAETRVCAGITSLVRA